MTFTIRCKDGQILGADINVDSVRDRSISSRDKHNSWDPTGTEVGFYYMKLTSRLRPIILLIFDP